MEISIRELVDYKNCPQLYKFRYIDSLPEKKNIRDLFRENIKKTISYYYFCMIDQKEKSLANLFKKWEQLWFTPQVEDFFPNEEVRKRSSDAINLLRNFYRYTKSEAMIPIAVDFKYNIILEGAHNLHITGNIDLIKVVNDGTRKKETDLVFFSYAPTMPDDFSSKIDLRTTLASYAFRKNFEIKESNLVLCNIGKKEQKKIIKESDDFSRAKKIVFNIATGINKRIFYPSDNVITCGKCKFKAFCMNEKAMEERNDIS